MKVREIVTLALRNLFRHGTRTAITAGAVAFGLIVFIAIDSILGGAEELSERNLIWYETGVAQVVEEGYLAERDERPLSYAIEDPGAVRTAIEQSGLEAAPRTVFSAELIVFQDPYPEDGSVFVTGYGIDPELDGDVYRLEETVAAGTFLESGSSGAVIGTWLAEDIGADIGYPFTLVTRTRHGYFQTIDSEVVGIIDTPNPIINRSGVFLPLDIVDTYLQMDGAVTEISVAPPAPGQFGDVSDRIQQHVAGFPEVTAVDWRELVADYIAITEQKQAGNGVIIFLVFVIAAVGISNTVLMSVLERTRELGMMRAIGMRDGEIRATLVTEAALIGLIGALAAVVVGAAINLFLVRYGIDYSAFLRDADFGYRLTDVFYGTWRLTTFVQAPLLGIGLSVLTALVPIRRALRMSIVDALRAA